MQEPTIRQLRHFLLIADTGSYRAAAERAFRSQSALSLSIRELERSLGGKLFESGRPARLSEFGRRCVPVARDVVERFDQQTRRLRGGAEGAVVTMAVLPSFANRWLPAFLNEFDRQHPDMQLKVLDDNSRNIEQMVLGGWADLGIVSLPVVDRRLDIKPLMKDVFGLVCSRGHPLAGFEELRWSEMEGLQVLGNQTHELLRGTRVERYIASPRLLVANMTSLLSVIAGGLWVSPLPVLAVPPKASEVAAVPLVRPRISREIGLIRMRAKRDVPAISAVEALIDSIQKKGLTV
jgi:DNA-binding transcriptional LysR family regulator